MDEIEFIEKYCLVNGKHIKLTNCQKEFIKWLKSYKIYYNKYLNTNK